MTVFIAVANAGSLSAAARRLGQPLTTVSRQLAALEAHVGKTLIARTTRHMALTDAGRSYLEACRRVLEDLEQAESRLSGRDDDLSGEIALTAPVVFGRLHVLPILGAFLERHPRLNGRVLLSDRVVDLAEEGIDIATRIGPLPDSSLVATRVGSLRMLTCAAPAYLKKHGRPRSPDDLEGHACVTFSMLAGVGRWTFASAAHGRRTVTIRARVAVNTAEAAVDAAIAGLGITRVLSYQAAAALARRRLTVVLGAYDDGEVPVHLVRRAARIANPKVDQFLTFAAGELRRRL
jgi:DNA-binding transcriptional LysR family regulator